MATNIVRLNPEYFPTPTIGRPLANADIYVGIIDLDPEIVGNQKQISVQQENGTITPISQPISTGAGGVPLYNGSPVTILVDGNYSLKVLNSSGSQEYYIPNVANFNDDMIISVNSMSDLLAISNQEDGEVAKVLGYFVTFPQAEFNGGGSFTWQSGLNKNLANGGTIIDPDNTGGFDGTISTLVAFLSAQGTGVGSGCWVKTTDKSVINVHEFGAPVDSITETIATSAAFNAAAQALGIVTQKNDTEVGPGRLIIPAGRFSIDEVDIPQGIIVEGASEWSSMIFWTSGDYGFKVVFYDTNGLPVESGGANQPPTVFNNLNLRGGGSGSNRKGNVYIKNNTATTVRNCWIAGSYVGIYDEGGTDIQIHHNVFDGVSTQVKIVNGRQVSIHNNKFFGTLVDAININLDQDAAYVLDTNNVTPTKTGTTDIEIIDNEFEELKDTGLHISTVGRLTIRGNRFNTANNFLVPTDSYIMNIDSVDYLYVENNVMFDPNFGDATYGNRMFGVDIDNIDKEFVFENNKINGTRTGYRLGGPTTAAQLNRVSIKHNSAIDTYQDALEIRSNAKGADVIDNFVFNPNEDESINLNAGSGIIVRADNCRLSGNRVGSDNQKMLRAVYIDTNVTGVMEEEPTEAWGWTGGEFYFAIGSGAELIRFVKPRSNNVSTLDGTYNGGDVIYKTNSSAGNPAGFLCTAKGTNSLYAGTTGSITNTETTLTLAVDPGNALRPGMYIDIVGVTGPQVITYVNGTTVEVFPAADATVVGAAVTIHAPTFNDMANVV